MSSDTTERQFFSIGYLCQLHQRSPSELRAMLTAARVEPSHYVNGVAHYDHRAVEACRRTDNDETN